MFAMRCANQVHQRFPLAVNGQTCWLQHHQQMWVFVQGGGRGFMTRCCAKVAFDGRRSSCWQKACFVLKIEIYTTNCYLLSTKHTRRMRIERTTWWVVLLFMAMWCEGLAQEQVTADEAFVERQCATPWAIWTVCCVIIPTSGNMDKVESQVQSFVAKRKAIGAKGMPSTVWCRWCFTCCTTRLQRTSARPKFCHNWTSSSRISGDSTRTKTTLGPRRWTRKLSFVSLFEIPTETPRRALSARRRESPCLVPTTP